MPCPCIFSINKPRYLQSMASQNNCFFTQIFDPSGQFIIHWNSLMFVVGLLNFLLDPLFMYLPSNTSTAFLQIDFRLASTFAALRMIGDFIRFLGIIIKFRTAYEDRGFKVFNKRRLIEDPRAIAIRYLKSTFIIDVFAALPLPQAYIWHQILSSSTALTATTDPMSVMGIYFTLLDIFWFQLPARLFVVIYFSKREITKVLMKSSMSGAFYNLLSFMILSNLAGSVYYHLHICWLLPTCVEKIEQRNMDLQNFEWDKFLFNCTQSNEIEQGMFSSVLSNKILTRNFMQKYMFCFAWGLKSLSSLGQNFSTSYSAMETTFSIFITLFGLIFFADLITRMQAAIQSMEEREEGQRARQREIREWVDYHQLPVELMERVDHSIQSEWTENGIDDEAMLDSLPTDLRSEIRKYLYMDSACKLPKFANMDAPLVETICQHLKTFSGKEGTYIVYEGDLVKQMLFIFSGQLELSFTDRGNSSISILERGDCCGQELVTWASQPTTSMDNLPTSSWTIKCLTDVEAFVLQAYDMKILATQFAHNHDFQHAFKQHYP